MAQWNTDPDTATYKHGQLNSSKGSKAISMEKGRYWNNWTSTSTNTNLALWRENELKMHYRFKYKT